MALIATIWRQAYIIFSFASLAIATCYHPNGTAVDSSYQPCNGSIPVSMCCHLGYSNNGGDMCGSGSSYGLCGITGSQLWRESCTDQSWESPYCLKLCITDEDEEITRCPDGSYCCGANNATCCEAGQGQFIVNDAVSNTSSTASSSAVPTTTPTTSSTAASSTSPSTTSTSPVTPSSVPAPSSNGLSTGAIVGLSIGIALGVIATILIAGFLFWKRRHRPKPLQTTTELDGAGNQEFKHFQTMNETDGTIRSELGTTAPRYEMDATGRNIHL